MNASSNERPDTFPDTAEMGQFAITATPNYQGEFLSLATIEKLFYGEHGIVPV